MKAMDVVHRLFVAWVMAGAACLNGTAQPVIINGSFEADGLPPFPGYGTITGWTPGGGIGTGYGINEFGMPFAGNGAVPDGTKVAFMQANGTLNQDVSGFQIGAQYWLTYRENARNDCCGGTCLISVRVGDAIIVGPHSLVPVGGTNPYHAIGSEAFIARQETLTLTIVKDGEGDISALIDLVEISEIPPNTPPTIWTDPKPQRADPGEVVTFTAAATGTTPMFFQWRFNGTPLEGETNKTLTLPQVGPQHAGNYQFVASNAAGSAHSANASLRVRTDIPVVINPSFEHDALPPYPGYGLITGWTPNAEIETSYGLNPMNGAFADSGAVPHGAKVAFLQHNGALSQTVSGFRAGAQYWLSYRENARQNCCGDRVATLSVTVGGIRVVPEHAVAIVGDANPYPLVTSQLFTAGEPALTITFEKGGTGDATALIDDVRIFPRDQLRVGVSMENGSVPLIRVDGAPGSSVGVEYKNSLLPTTPWQHWINAPVTDWSALLLEPQPSPTGERFFRAFHAP